MTSFSLRAADLEPPVPLRLHPAADQADQAARDFLYRHGVVDPELGDDYLAETDFGAMVGCMYPDARPEMLPLLAQWMALWSVADDQLEALAPQLPPAELDALCTRLTGLLAAPGPAEDSVLGTAVAHAWQALAARTSAQWQARFRQAWHEYVEGCRWEAVQTGAGRTPTVAEYLDQRPRYLGAHIAIVLTEAALDIELPEAVVDDPLLRSALDAGIELIAISNDLLSAEVELAQGSTLNLVAILAAQESCSLGAATGLLVARYRRRLADYRGAVAAVEAAVRAFPVWAPAVRAVAAAPGVWTSGQLAWSTGNARYSDRRAVFNRSVPDHVRALVQQR
ncbi:terpene synthase family protein [Catellatospora sp. KI3]|uniref:terpene synthase family protein n=1 Tax=Catellatospora sp. KI3 TaxID=3041620 RepID=UPI0024822973|nr:terpene synthase family protein [Catellatospora sp. KI3]MDI1462945.1 terpene synthase family protein [Catellatospora sp. KI3]